MENFYCKFQLISKFPLWPLYLRWVYKKAIQDSLKFSIIPIDQRRYFTSLLCGVSGEITANEYIKFVLNINQKAKIIIIDLRENQINSVNKLVKENYLKANIEVIQANALNLSFIKNKSVDWIDTDGFFSFFNKEELLNLFIEWKRILRDDGFITFRELTSNGFFTTIANRARALFAKTYMGIELNLHSTTELEHNIKRVGFKSKRGISPIPLLDRYCLINGL